VWDPSPTVLSYHSQSPAAVEHSTRNYSSSRAAEESSQSLVISLTFYTYYNYFPFSVIRSDRALSSQQAYHESLYRCRGSKEVSSGAVVDGQPGRSGAAGGQACWNFGFGLKVIYRRLHSYLPPRITCRSTPFLHHHVPGVGIAATRGRVITHGGVGRVWSCVPPRWRRSCG
jgi:hypothetical protein